MKCLFISSRPFTHSANLFDDLGKALENAGIEVDYLCKRHKSVQLQSHSPIISPDSTPLQRFFGKIFSGFGKKKGFYSKKLIRKKFKGQPAFTNNDITIQYHDEARPVVPPEPILAKLNTDYDFVITGFWQDMINSTFLKAVYDKLQVPILVVSVDMAPMTGGCYYFGKCRNFENGCGNCPGFNSSSKTDQSAENYRIKKENYHNAKIAFLGNTWMNGYVRRSKLFPENRIFLNELQLDPDVFVSTDKGEARRRFNIDADSFVIMLRSTDIGRKGGPDQLQAVEKFTKQLSDEDKAKVVVLTVGDDTFEKGASHMDITVKNLGTVGKDELINAYNAASLFLCASHDDAGPSMINQSIMCGTPVVSYNSGAALDVITDGESGYKFPKGDVAGLAEGIMKIFRKTNEEYSRLSARTREIALEHNSIHHFPSRILSILSTL